eukprot:NODE_1090_length_678_cov_573.046105_g850_i0.p1 GENE.NODE_1090_length_678_cov_573.046105_g850_i0~~NODE_1090_length_678_cov_573.046105_g850_i0.p1  ORF type:complete len:194 (-),score=51.26 NODE_1090_length_678_cov_573.046105_g850_i0:52-633(-)
MHEGDYAQAIRWLQHWLEQLGITHEGVRLELHAMVVDIYLRWNRYDLAKKELEEKMLKIDDDATVSQLCQAWVNMAIGGERPVNEAIGIFEDLKAKFGGGVLVLNNLALAHMSLGDFAEAEKCLLMALEKRSGDSETLINLIVVSQHLHKPTNLVQRFLAPLKGGTPHPWVQQYAAVESKFDRMIEMQPRRAD